MTIVKWKNPSVEGKASNPVVFNSPFSGLLDNFFGGDFLTREFASYMPAVNFSEEKTQFNLELSAPGFVKEDFKIEFNKGILTISAEHKTETETSERTYSRKEFNYGSFSRSFNVPESVDENAIDAKYENGILKLTLAKKEEAKKEAIEIKIS